MEEPDLTGLEYRGPSTFGTCPHCKYYVSYLAGVRTESLDEVVADGGYVRCPECSRWIGSGDLSRNPNRLRDSYKRERQFKAANSDYVDYGALKNIEHASGVSFGNSWSGTVDDIAAHARMSVEDVQRQWPKRPALKRQPTLEELREMGTIELSL